MLFTLDSFTLDDAYPVEVTFESVKVTMLGGQYIEFLFHIGSLVISIDAEGPHQHYWHQSRIHLIFTVISSTNDHFWSAHIRHLISQSPSWQSWGDASLEEGGGFPQIWTSGGMSSGPFLLLTKLTSNPYLENLAQEDRSYIMAYHAMYLSWG